MIKGKTLRHTLDKFLKNSEVGKEARVQVSFFRLVPR
jgi:hypothetical protein